MSDLRLMETIETHECVQTNCVVISHRGVYHVIKYIRARVEPEQLTQKYTLQCCCRYEEVHQMKATLWFYYSFELDVIDNYIPGFSAEV